MIDTLRDVMPHEKLDADERVPAEPHPAAAPDIDMISTELGVDLDAARQAAEWMASDEGRETLSAFRAASGILRIAQGDTSPESYGPPATAATLQLVAGERAAQDAKWGEQNHAPMEWLSVLGEEVGEASKEANIARWSDDPAVRRTALERYRTEMLQVAAVAVATVESLDRNELGG